MLSCVSLGPGLLSSDTSEVCNKDACSAPCNVLLILSSQLREPVCLTGNDAIKRELLIRQQMAKIFAACFHESSLIRLTEPRKSLCKHLIGREFLGKQVIRTSSNHYLVEEFFLVGEMTVDRLHGNACGFGDPVHRRSREAVPQKVLARSKHNRAILLGDHDCF